MTVATAAELVPGITLGRFALVRRLGVGGMGEVWEAFDSELDRAIAIKVLERNRLASEISRKRLRREAQVMAKVSHPNIAVVHEVGSADGHVFIAMELMHETLRSWLDTRRDWREIVARFVSIARGLAAAHQAGIVHHDFKPENVLLGTSGETKVADFGLASQEVQIPLDEPVEPFVSIATDEGIAGTPAYMAPEQILGRNVGPRADQFGFCVALWEALYGAPPFEHTSIPGFTLNLRLGEITESRIKGPTRASAPRGLERLLRRGLEPDPERRFPSMDAVADALVRMSKPRAGMMRAIGIATVVCAALLIGAVTTTRKQPVDSGGGRLATRPLLSTAAFQQHPLVAISRDGRMAICDRTGTPSSLQLARIDGVERTRVEVPEGLAVTRIAISSQSDTMLIAGRRGALWELWRVIPGRAPTRMIALPLPLPPLDHDERIEALGDNEAIVSAGGAILRISNGAAIAIAPTTPGVERHTIAVSPSANAIAILENIDGRDQVRIVDRNGWTSHVVENPIAGLVSAMAWIDEERLALVELLDRGTEIVEVQIAHPSSPRSLGTAEVYPLEAFATPQGLALLNTERAFGIEVWTSEGTFVRRLSATGWDIEGDGVWIDDREIAFLAGVADRHAVVAFHLDGSERVLAEGGASPIHSDGRTIIVRDTRQRGCTIRAIRDGATVARSTTTCEGDPELICASATEARCLLARWENHKLVFREFDAIAMKIGAVIHGDDQVRDASIPIRPALSTDKWLAIPFHRGLRIVDLEHHTVATISAPAGEAWIEAEWLGDHRILITAIGDRGGARLLRADRDGKQLEVTAQQHDVIHGARVSPDGQRIAFATTDIKLGWVEVSR